MSKIDKLYRQLIFTGFFKRGWGNSNHINDLLRLRHSLGDPTSAYAVEITNGLLKNVRVTIEKETKQENVVFLEASFISPLHEILPHMMPVECRTARFQFMYKDKSAPSYSGTTTTQPPVALHLAGTGDHFFYRRRALQGNPLLKEYGVNSVFLENPFYGYRKPKDQLRSSVHYVNDIFIMGAALILESWVVLNWLIENRLGSTFCLTGVSMGGFMASLAAGFWRRCPVSLVPCLSWSSAAPVYTEGVLADALPWKELTAQYLNTPALQKMRMEITRGDYGAKYINDGNGAASPIIDGRDVFSDETFRHVSNVIPTGSSASSPSADSTSSPTARKYSTSSSLESSKSNHVGWLSSKSPGSSTIGTGNFDGDRYEVARNFMKNIMDQFTHLGNYSAPLDPRLTQFMVATHDAYVPSHANPAFLGKKKSDGKDGMSSCDDMRAVWPGCSTVELHNVGHVGAYLFKQKEYSRVIKSNIDRLQSMYCST